MNIRKGAIFSLKMTINYNISICCRWADLSSSLTWPAWLSALHLGPAPSYVAPAFFRIGYQSSSLSLLWQSYRENIRNNFSPEGFCWRPSIASKTFTTIVADQPTALPGLEKLHVFMTSFKMPSVFETLTILMMLLRFSWLLYNCHQFSRPGQFSWSLWPVRHSACWRFPEVSIWNFILTTFVLWKLPKSQVLC